MPAAWEGSSFFLTYPQSDFDIQGFLDHFKSIEFVVYVLVSSEKHQDLSLHRHAIVHFSKKQRLPKDFFDYQGRHPNIRCVGKKKSDWQKVSDYVRKDKEFLESGEPRHSGCVWSSIAKASSRDEAQSLLLAEKPRDAVLNARNFDYWLDKVFPVQTSPSFTPRGPEQFVLPDSLQEWVLMSWWYVSVLCGQHHVASWTRHLNPPLSRSPPRGLRGLPVQSISKPFDFLK